MSASNNIKVASLDGRMEYFKQGGKDVFAKAQDFIEADMIRQLNIYPYYQTIDSNEGPLCIIEGK
ncbi:MAG TPA: 8-amino-7-oxononanoate synthase, partial [bacterium]|nr:8-amino-7-oxononanoate synthase [bacterium]